ncbi:hypothetical protein C0966_17455 (plasmid) [Bacillus methanolicus]|nr:hypothetical protein [Bacillus methanolicus]
MYMYFRRVGGSVIFLTTHFALQQLQLNFVGFAMMCMISGGYISHILTSRINYTRANQLGLRHFKEFKHAQKIENYVYSLMETLIVASLVNLNYFVENSFVSNMMFSLGAGYLLVSHFIRNKEEYRFYQV